jgi:hypothetical protein
VSGVSNIVIVLLPELVPRQPADSVSAPTLPAAMNFRRLTPLARP